MGTLCASFQQLDDGRFYGEVPDCPGVVAVENTLELCEAQLCEILRVWLEFQDLSGAPAQCQPRVLVIDDEVVARVLVVMFRRLGCANVAVCTPGEAVALAERLRPELIMLDYSSDLLLERLHAHGAPIIVTASWVDSALRNHCLALGAREVLEKPFGIETVERILNSQARRTR